jgi:hypothetical protein
LLGYAPDFLELTAEEPHMPDKYALSKGHGCDDDTCEKYGIQVSPAFMFAKLFNSPRYGNFGSL